MSLEPSTKIDEAEDTIFEPAETDATGPGHARVVMDQASLELLSGSTVDFTTELIGSQFKVINPRATSNCGCDSFKMPWAYESVGVVSGEGAKSQVESAFLAYLPPDTPVYHYEKQADLGSLFPPFSVEDRFVVLKHVPPKVLEKHEGRLPGRCNYSPLLRILIITMPSLPHEEAASSFEIMMVTLFKEMRVYRRIYLCGATRVDTPNRKKQADRSWKPTRQHRKFPTVALEVRFSETTAKLERDIAWWINESKGEVKMGITIDIKPRSGHIEVKSWTAAFESLSSHVYITANGRQVLDRHINHLPPPRMTHRILLKRGINGAGPTIEGGDLVIPFRSLLLDEPGEGEGDFVITADTMLRDFAERIWDGIDDAEAIKAQG
ncbi:[4Fe-4S] proteins maturation [Talaromyces marneffei ATCC 18224]